MIYLISLIDGLILCFLIFIVSFVSMLVLQIRDRKKFYQREAAYGFQHPSRKVRGLDVPLRRVGDTGLIAGDKRSYERGEQV